MLSTTTINDLPVELTTLIYDFCDEKTKANLGLTSQFFHQLFILHQINKKYAKSLLAVLGGTEKVADFPIYRISDEQYNQIRYNRGSHLYLSFPSVYPAFTGFKRGDMKHPLIAFCSKTTHRFGLTSYRTNIMAFPEFPTELDYLQRLIKHEPAGTFEESYVFCPFGPPILILSESKDKEKNGKPKVSLVEDEAENLTTQLARMIL